MNFEAHNHFMNNAAAIVAKYGRVSFDICVYLAWRANADTGACYPSRQTIANDIGCTLKAVKMALPKLKNAGLLDWKADGRGSNHYTFPCVNNLTIDKAREIAKIDGIPAERSDKIYNDLQGYQWTDGNGDPIINRKAYFKAAIRQPLTHDNRQT